MKDFNSECHPNQTHKMEASETPSGRRQRIGYPSRQSLFPGITLLVILIFLLFSPAIFQNASIFDVDLRYVQTPIKWFLFKAENKGVFPLWTENIGCGYPIHAYGEGGLFYPLNWLIYPLLPIPIAHDVTLMIHLLIAGTGMLLLGRNYYRDPIGSLVSAILFSFSGWTVIHFGHLNSIQVLAWMPWAFLALDMNRYLFRPVSIIFLGILLSLMWFAGRPQITFYVWIALVIHSVFHVFGRGGSFRLLLILGLGTILGLLLAAPQILPTIEFARLSNRADGMPFKEQLVGTLSWRQFIWIIAPLWQKRSTVGVPSESIGYIGMAGGILLIASVFHVKRRFYAGWWVILIISLILSTGERFPLNPWIYQLPGFSFFRTPARWLSVSVFAASMLGGYGAERVIGLVKESGRRKLIRILVALMLFFDLSYFVHPLVTFMDRKAQEAVPFVLPVLSKGARYLNLSRTPISNYELEGKNIPSEEFVTYFRTRESLLDNYGMRYGLNSVKFYTGLHLKWIGRALSQVTLEGLSAMNCEFIVSPEPISKFNLRQVWKNSFFRIYRNERVEPRIRFVDSLIQKGEQGSFSTVQSPGVFRILDERTSQDVTIEVESGKSCYLILADAFYPGWKAWVNDKEASIIRVNGWMRAVPIPGGGSIIKFRYQPRSFGWGLILAFIGILLCIASLIYLYKVRKW